jgi:hypothetical protein
MLQWLGRAMACRIRSRCYEAAARCSVVGESRSYASATSGIARGRECRLCYKIHACSEQYTRTHGSSKLLTMNRAKATASTMRHTNSRRRTTPHRARCLQAHRGTSQQVSGHSQRVALPRGPSKKAYFLADSPSRRIGTSRSLPLPSLPPDQHAILLSILAVTQLRK